MDQASEPRRGQPRLLAVDDHPASAELMARVASRAGYDARYVSDPLDVAAMIECWDPEIVATDLCMPNVDAIELLTVIRASGFKGRLLFVSGQDDWIRRQAAKLATAHGFEVIGEFCKPVDIQQMRQFLTDAMLPAA